MTDWRDLPPIEPIERPKRLRQTVLRHASNCPRSAYLYLKHEGGAGGSQLDRGTAFHRFAERATKAIIEQGERMIPGEVAKAIVDEILEEPDLVLSPFEADRVREMAFHWAEGVVIDPETVIAVEERFTWDVDGVTVSGTIDLARLLSDREFGAILELDDYKTTFNLPEQADYGRTRRDGTVRYTGFQGVLYSLLTLRGVPSSGISGLGDGVNLWRPAQVFPAYLRDVEGHVFLASRSGTITRPELADDEAYMKALIRKLIGYFAYTEEPCPVCADDPYATHPPHVCAGGVLAGQKWSAVPGSHCSECPSPTECPLPAELRRHQGVINTPEQAQEAAEWHDRQQALLGATWKELRAYVKAHGRLRFGRDLVLEPGHQERVEIRKREEMFAAIDRAVQFGEPFDSEAWIRRSDSSPVKRRVLTPDELAEEAADAE
jgi:hypothetical protein